MPPPHQNFMILNPIRLRVNSNFILKLEFVGQLKFQTQLFRHHIQIYFVDKIECEKSEKKVLI